MQDAKAGRLTFTPASPEEEESIQDGLATYITNDAVNELLVGHHLVIGKGRRHEVFLLSPLLWRLYQQLHPKHPYFIGIFLGELKKGTLEPSLHLLHRLAENVKPSAKIVAVAKGEQKFLYGHSLEPDEFQTESPLSGKSKQVLVVNNQKEGLGYGRLTKTPVGADLLKNQLDLGWYLRRGR